MTPTYQGSTIPIFSVPPDFSNPVELTEGYGNIILEALSTAEERHYVQPRPLYGAKYYALTMSSQETGYLRKVVEQAKALPIGVGLWQDALIISSAFAGSAFVECDPTAGTLFDIVGWAMVWHCFNKWDVARVFSIGPTGIQLDAALSNSYAAGDKIVPICFGKLKRQGQTPETDTLGTFKVDFEEMFFAELPAFSFAISGSDQYGGLQFMLETDGGSYL